MQPAGLWPDCQKQSPKASTNSCLRVQGTAGRPVSLQQVIIITRLGVGSMPLCCTQQRTREKAKISKYSPCMLCSTSHPATGVALHPPQPYLAYISVCVQVAPLAW
jgi:hypothetical protein